MLGIKIFHMLHWFVVRGKCFSFRFLGLDETNLGLHSIKESDDKRNIKAAFDKHIS